LHTRSIVETKLNPGDTFTIEGVYVKENLWRWLLRKIRKQPRRLQSFTVK